MPTTDFLPTREADLVTWVNTFNGLISTGATTYGLTAGQATAFGALATAWTTAFALANGDGTRTHANIIAKNEAKRNVIASIRELAAIIQAFPGTTDEMRAALGLTVRALPSPIPAPTQPPMLEIKERLGTWMRIRLHDGSGTTRAKPDGVQGARVYTFIGTTAPVDINAWTLEGQATRTYVDLEFGPSATPGTIVWLTAQWYSARGLTGPACQPVSTVIAGGAMPEAA